jgi:hypothetical protein
MNFDSRSSPPKPPPSARNQASRKRPVSANPRSKAPPLTSGTSATKEKRPADEAATLLTLQREDLISTILLMKKEMHAQEAQISVLRTEKQRIESEAMKQQRRIEKILGSQGANGQVSIEARKEIEKSVLVRQLKAQVSSLRTAVNEKDVDIQELKKNMRATVATELTAEKEEYYLEVGTLTLH